MTSEQFNAAKAMFYREVSRQGWQKAREWFLGHKLLSDEVKTAVMDAVGRRNTANLKVYYEKDVEGNRPRPGAFE